jgi:magnesium transporter
VRALTDLPRTGDTAAAVALLTSLELPAAIDELERVDDATRALAVAALPDETMVAVVERLDPSLQRDLLARLDHAQAQHLLHALDPDDRVALLDACPAALREQLVAGLEPAEQALTRAVLAHRPGTVGRRMSPEVAAVPMSSTVGEALEDVRAQAASAETIYTVAVVDEANRVRGVISLRRLLATDPHVSLTAAMSRPVTVRTTDDQELAAQRLLDHRVVGVPVVAEDGRLVGVFTVDDAMLVLEQEVDEDLARSGGTEPLDRPYLTTTILGTARRRIVWLLVLIVAATLTVNVLNAFEDTLAEVVALALFIPLLIGTAGNTGAQASTTLTRALALGDVRFRDLPRVAGREALTGMLLGSALAVVGLIPAVLVAGGQVAVVVGVTLVVICTLATTVGSCTPLLVQRIGLDPAVTSGPFITTFVDAVGLVVYFLVAGAVLGL